MYDSTRSNVPTYKIERRRRRWALCEVVCVSIIQLAEGGHVPSSCGCINDSGILIIHSDVLLCVNSEQKETGQEC